MTLRLFGSDGIEFPDGSEQETAARVAAAWVNFNGTGTVAIRADYNVSSITDNGTGDYTVNLTEALADTNGAILSHVSSDGSSAIGWPASAYYASASALRVFTAVSGATAQTLSDRQIVCLGVFR